MEKRKKGAIILWACFGFGLGLLVGAFLVTRFGVERVDYANAPLYVSADGRVYPTENVYVFTWEYNGEQEKTEVIAYYNPAQTAASYEAFAKSHLEHYFKDAGVPMEEIAYWVEKVPLTVYDEGVPPLRGYE